jgi:hypothetical protein
MSMQDKTALLEELKLVVAIANDAGSVPELMEFTYLCRDETIRRIAWYAARLSDKERDQLAEELEVRLQQRAPAVPVSGSHES